MKVSADFLFLAALGSNLRQNALEVTRIDVADGITASNIPSALRE